MNKIFHAVVSGGYLCLNPCRVSREKVAETEKDVTCKNCLRILAREKFVGKYNFGGALIGSSLAPVVSAGD